MLLREEQPNFSLQTACVLLCSSQWLEKRCQEPLSQLEGQAVKVVQLGTFFEMHGFFVMSG